MHLSCKFAQRSFRVHIGTINFANAMTIFMAEHFQRKIQPKMIGRHLPTIILTTHFANAMTIFYGRAFIKARWPPLEMDAKQLAIISIHILQMLGPYFYGGHL